MPIKVTNIFVEGLELEEAQPGDNVRLRLLGIEEEDVRPGFIISSVDSPVSAVRAFDARVNVLEYKSIICAGYTCVMHIHACVEEVQLVGIIAKLDKKTGEAVQKKPKFIRPGEAMLARFKTSQPICVERYKEYQQLGRFMLRDEGDSVNMLCPHFQGRTVAIGVITELIFPKVGGSAAASQAADS